MKIKIREFFYLSNLLSLSRIILLIPFIYLIRLDNLTAHILFVLVSAIIILTDALDGYFARKLNQITELGIVLDPIADKIAMAIGMIVLIIYRNFPVSLVVFLLYRDLMIVIIGWIAIKKTSKPEMANMYGKINTVVVSFTAFLCIIKVQNIIFDIFVYLSYAIILISGISYAGVGQRKLCNKIYEKVGYWLFLIILTAIIIYYTWKLGWL
ncbi:MAG: CDP-alcohol phosphatidyltransferase family protein [Calditrichaceae bacterium]|nr:CDP-alcohol phosphatidyltransferase family protein [Calditrichaceae bacterium]